MLVWICLTLCACLDLSVSSSSWGLGRAAVCDCGTPWTFLLPFVRPQFFFFFFFFFFLSNDRSKAVSLFRFFFVCASVVSVLVLLFVALWFNSTRRFVLCLTLCHFVLVFFSPFSIATTSVVEKRANLSTFRTFVRFVLVWICRFPLPLGVWEKLRFVIVALPGFFSYLFFFFFFFFFFICGVNFVMDPHLFFRYSGRLCFAIVAFSGYLYLYFFYTFCC